MEFIEILKELMEKKRLSQTALAKMVGVKQSQVCEWLKGKSKPGYDNLRAICFELNQGYSLEECMSDLNISQSDDVAFDAILTFENGVTYCAYSVHMNLARPDHSASRWFYGPVGKRIYLDYNENDIVIQNGQMVIPGDKLNARIDDEELWQLSEEEEKTKREEFAKIKPRNLIFKKVNYQTVARLAV